MKKFSIPIYFTSFWRRHLQLKKTSALKNKLCFLNFVFFYKCKVRPVPALQSPS